MNLKLKIAAAAAAAMGSLAIAQPATAAQTTPASQTATRTEFGTQASWHAYGASPDHGSCSRTGVEGVASGRWQNYRCDHGWVWFLYVYY